jgi:hypothetical protein
VHWGVTVFAFFGCLCAAAAQTESVAKFGSNVVIPGGLRGLVYHIPHDTSRLPDFQKLKAFEDKKARMAQYAESVRRQGHGLRS